MCLFVFSRLPSRDAPPPPPLSPPPPALPFLLRLLRPLLPSGASRPPRPLLQQLRPRPRLPRSGGASANRRLGGRQGERVAAHAVGGEVRKGSSCSCPCSCFESGTGALVLHFCLLVQLCLLFVFSPSSVCPLNEFRKRTNNDTRPLILLPFYFSSPATVRTRSYVLYSLFPFPFLHSAFVLHINLISFLATPPTTTLTVAAAKA